MLIHGNCHCGNISFDLDWKAEDIAARACDCSFCVKHGGLWTSSPTASLEVTVRNPSLVSRYAFGTRTAVFHICTGCGVAPVATSEIEGNLYAVISVNAFNGVDPSLIRRAPASFESEDTESRLARRKRNWIGSVQFVESGV
jgi:hypothetical protein